MATLRIRAIDEKVKAGLCVQAARRAASTEWRALGILEQCGALGPTHDEPFAERVRRRFAAIADPPAIALHHRVRLATLRFEGLRLPARPHSELTGGSALRDMNRVTMPFLPFALPEIGDEEIAAVTEASAFRVGHYRPQDQAVRAGLHRLPRRRRRKHRGELRDGEVCAWHSKRWASARATK